MIISNGHPMFYRPISTRQHAHTLVIPIFPIYMVFNCSTESTYYCVIRRNAANKNASYFWHNPNN